MRYKITFEQRVQKFLESKYGTEIFRIIDKAGLDNADLALVSYFDNFVGTEAFQVLNEVSRLLAINPYKFRTYQNQRHHTIIQIINYYKAFQMDKQIDSLDDMNKDQLANFIDAALEQFPFYDKDISGLIFYANQRYFELEGEYYLQEI